VSELHSSEIWSVALFATPTGINETPVNKPLAFKFCVHPLARIPDLLTCRSANAAICEPPWTRLN
jgi:hypothetical protein